MFCAKKITAKEAQRLSVDTQGPWIGEPSKRTWHVEEQEGFYVTNGEVFITVNEEKYHIIKNWVVSLNKDLVCEQDSPEFLKKNYKLNHEINL